MRNYVDITGQTFGRLTALFYLGAGNWRCSCICGNITEACYFPMKVGSRVSCGCYLKEVIRLPKTHGLSRTTEHKVWGYMKARCRKNHKYAHSYFERGIRVCERWSSSFENFLADMGKRPSEKHSIERVNNDLGYGPDNCVWATDREQRRNKRCNVLLSKGEKTMCASDWDKELGLSEGLVSKRLRIGWTKEEALSPKRQFTK